jgi:hypothetical protein
MKSCACLPGDTCTAVQQACMRAPGSRHAAMWKGLYPSVTYPVPILHDDQGYTTAHLLVMAH